MTLAKTQLAATIALAMIVIVPMRAVAHPMGNFSINHYTRISPGRKFVELRYLIDMAEIPTFQEIQRTGIVAKEGDPKVVAYLPAEGRSLATNLSLTVNGRALPLELISSNAIFPPGAGGLPTMKLGFVYRAPLHEVSSADAIKIDYRDNNFEDRAGWKEIIAVAGDGAAIVSSSVPAKDRSAELSNYPTDVIHSPPQILEASISFKTGVSGTEAATGTSASIFAMRGNAQGTPRSAFTELITSPRHSLLFLMTAALIAAGLGGLHALEPGHGKTLVAAYLVGSRSNFRHVLLLGSIVTTSHTAAVYVLGITTLYASQWILPDHLYPWLGLASGLLVAGVGLVMLMRRIDDSADHHSHTHSHDGSTHSHVQSDHDHLDQPHRHNWLGQHVHSPADDVAVLETKNSGDTPLRELFALGITGGIVPCPAALVVLLSAIAIRRVAFGLFLIVAFSFGLAAVLIFFGLTMVYARRFMSRFKTDSPLISRWLPMASSAVITIVGVTMAITSLMSAGILQPKL